MVLRMKNFLREVKLEFKNVNWLSRKEVINYTIIVVLFSLGIAMFLGFFDYIFNFALINFVF
jgi:preprotein translocase SecE subunit